MRTRLKTQGFTLPEILVAGTMLAALVVAVTSSMRVNLGLDRETELKRQASIRLRSAIDSTYYQLCPRTSSQWDTWVPPTYGACFLAPGGAGDPSIPCSIVAQTASIISGDIGGRIIRYREVQIQIQWESQTLSQALVSPRTNY